MNNDVSVTVFCLVYNHAKYLRQCLDGFVMQKTNFKFEVLIHDDASTDESASIIREYELKYPDIIRPYYNKENMYSKKIPIIKTFLYPMARGKYIALCEGDDFWCDQNKLQVQFDIMEKHPECHICFHRVQGKQENGIDDTHIFPRKNVNLKEGNLSTLEIIQLATLPYQFQTSCYFVRKCEYEHFLMNPPEFRKKSPVGDVPLMLYMASLGDGYFVNRIMSCYRQNSINSWCYRLNKASYEQKRERWKKMIIVFNLYNDFTHHRYNFSVNSLLSRANEKISEICFVECCHKKDYLKCISPKYHGFLMKESWKTILYFHLKAFIQFIRKML